VYFCQISNGRRRCKHAYRRHSGAEFQQVSNALSAFLNETSKAAWLKQVKILEATGGKSLVPLLREAFAEHGDPNTQNISVFKIRLAVWCGCALHPQEFSKYYHTQYIEGRSPDLDDMRAINMKDGMSGQTLVQRLLTVREATRKFFERYGTSWDHQALLEFLNGLRATIRETQFSDAELRQILEAETAEERQRRYGQVRPPGDHVLSDRAGGLAVSTVIDCPACAQKMRVPTDRGRLAITCRNCRHRWEWSPAPAAGPTVLATETAMIVTTLRCESCGARFSRPPNEYCPACGGAEAPPECVVHKWDGCVCSHCGQKRTKGRTYVDSERGWDGCTGHDWSRGYERCAKCGESGYNVCTEAVDRSRLPNPTKFVSPEDAESLKANPRRDARYAYFQIVVSFLNMGMDPRQSYWTDGYVNTSGLYSGAGKGEGPDLARPLINAIAYDNLEMITMMQTHGVGLKAPCAGKSLLEHAEHYGSKSVASYLRRY